jgi:hypothetical protein
MTPNATAAQPSWWTAEHAAGWENARPGVKESWGKKTGTDQTPASDEFTAAEPALRFGHGARHHYDTTGRVTWKEVEPKLEADWTKLNQARPWAHARQAVMHGWDSHTRGGSHIGSSAATRSSASGLGSSPAGDSGSGSGDS